ncbi:MAG: SIMPL domain-containing protein [Pseudomonadota bacterium]
MQSAQNLLAGLAVGIGLAALGYFVSQTTLNGRTGANTAEVKGLSERVVKADIATWKLAYQASANWEVPISDTFDQATRDLDTVEDALESLGFLSDEVRVSPIFKNDRIRTNNNNEIIDQWYVVEAEISISTNEPQKVEAARSEVLALVQDNIGIREQSIFYDFTNLNEIKPDMLREATENARLAANEFASNAGVKVGGIQSARQGGFGIEPVGADPLDRKVRVVTTVTFYLEN